MKYKRITKATFSAFIKALASECAAVGIEKSNDPWGMGEGCYEVFTKAGRYLFRVMSPYGSPRKIYDVTVFGRFDNEKAAAKRVDCNPHSGKWNFHAGYCTEQEAREYATHIVTRILNV